MTSIAIITARGGSKRIPKKNIKNFLGHPIIEYSIKACLESKIFDVVMVSTDSEEIADTAKKAGAEVPFLRSSETSNDHATTDDVLKEVLQQYSLKGMHFDIMACVYPTAPFITAGKLIEAYETLNKTEKATAVMPVVEYSFPPQRANVIRDGLLEYQFPEFRLKRSQDLEPIYHDAGQFYFYKISNDNHFSEERFVPIILSDVEVQDIDNESDWKIAEIKYSLINKK